MYAALQGKNRVNDAEARAWRRTSILENLDGQGGCVHLVTLVTQAASRRVVDARTVG